VTEADFLRRVEIGTERNYGSWITFFMGPAKLAEEYVHSHGRKVAEVMTPDPVTVETPARVEPRKPVSALPGNAPDIATRRISQ
jgi:hypothetical protein